MDLLVEMLRRQRELQERLGYDFIVMTEAERVQYVKDMYVAAVQELGEALNETTWKPWAHGRAKINTPLFLAELNDAWQFLANMWLAVMPGATPEVIATFMHEAHSVKIEINHQRIHDNYDGKNKCSHCGRALDEVPVEEVRIGGDVVRKFCGACHAPLSS